MRCSRSKWTFSDRTHAPARLESANVQQRHNFYRMFAHRLSMSLRIRHCVQCPKCLTLYLVSASPYGNGSYLVRTLPRTLEEYTLYCSCSSPAATSRWRDGEMRPCEVSKSAHRRGFGSPSEILAMDSRPRKPWRFNIADYLDPSL